MPKRKVCKKCGYVNEYDNCVCSYCDEDVSVSSVEINSPRNETREFYDYIKGKFCDSSPFLDEEKKTENKEEASARVETRDASKVAAVADKQVKICPACGFENSSCADVCEKCGMLMGLVPAVAAPEKKEPFTDGVLFEDEELPDDDFSDEEEGYSIVVGVSGENTYPVIFQDNRFMIGRSFQGCFAEEMTVSRKHCYIKLLDDGRFALFEMKTAPSTNHTYVKHNGGRLEEIIPGKGYYLTDGSIFYVTKDIPVLFRKNVC